MRTSFESAASTCDKEQTLADTDPYAGSGVCREHFFEVLQGTLRRAHAVATTMAESRVLGEHLVSESLHVLLSYHEVFHGHQSEKQERITCSLEC